MQDKQQQLIALHRRWFERKATDEETEAFFQLLKEMQAAEDAQLYPMLKDVWERVGETTLFDEAKKEALALRILDDYPVIQKNNVILYRMRQWRWAAAALLILAIGSCVYYFSNQSSKLPANIGGTGGTVGTRVDVAPGTNRAVLTINNKQNIDLASDKTGININSTITYNDGEKIADAGQLLQLTTPRGGQYQAVLPDGSKVWLNAASSIKFPSRFSNKERRVEITGEAYFEIAKNAQKPFIVTTSKDEIIVLGTSFNVNAYADESAMKATLLEGSIKVNQQILQPGQAYQSGKIMVANTEQDVAWKNGIFNFAHLPLVSVMRQLARWYDVETVYLNGIPDIRLYGNMDRSLTLEQVLESLRDMGINCRLEGKKIIITP